MALSPSFSFSKIWVQLTDEALSSSGRQQPTAFLGSLLQYQHSSDDNTDYPSSSGCSFIRSVLTCCGKITAEEFLSTCFPQHGWLCCQTMMLHISNIWSSLSSREKMCVKFILLI
jgi:hypothetical protein